MKKAVLCLKDKMHSFHRKQLLKLIWIKANKNKILIDFIFSLPSYQSLYSEKRENCFQSSQMSLLDAKQTRKVKLEIKKRTISKTKKFDIMRHVLN